MLSFCSGGGEARCSRGSRGLKGSFSLNEREIQPSSLIGFFFTRGGIPLVFLNSSFSPRFNGNNFEELDPRREEEVVDEKEQLEE